MQNKSYAKHDVNRVLPQNGSCATVEEAGRSAYRAVVNMINQKRGKGEASKEKGCADL